MVCYSVIYIVYYSVCPSACGPSGCHQVSGVCYESPKPKVNNTALNNRDGIAMAARNKVQKIRKFSFVLCDFAILCSLIWKYTALFC